jgi:opacity protein-like surface antigen
MKKRIGLVAAMAFGVLFSQAQQKVTTPGGTTFGIRGGVNFQSINGKDGNDDKLENDLLIGFNAGFNIEIPVAPDFYLQPGVLFTRKGTKSEDDVFGSAFESKVKISYVGFPLNFIYKPTLGQGKLLLGFGPYVALGVGGKVEYNGGGANVEQDIKFKRNVSASDPDDVFYLRKLDAGANMLAGYEFSNKLSFQLNAQLGLLDINPEYEAVSNDKTSWKNTGFGLSLGYRF